MMIVVFPFPSIVIQIHRMTPSVFAELDLEKRGFAGTFNPGISVIARIRIISVRPGDHGRGHIAPVIRYMGIHVIPGSVIMGNHFPPVILAMIREIGTPLSVDLAPLRVTRFWKISMK